VRKPCRRVGEHVAEARRHAAGLQLDGPMPAGACSKCIGQRTNDAGILKCSLSRDRCGQQARARPAPTCRASAVAMQSVSHQREAAERQARPALLVTGRERIQAGAGARAASRAPREQRTHQRSGHLKKWRAAGSCSPSRLRGWTVKKRLLLKRKNKPIPTKLAHAGNCNQSDRRIGTRIRCARVDVPPRPLTTKASTPFLE
jgi:hypothetical protein